MAKLCVLLVLALAFNQALGMNLRQKRQVMDEGDLEDRYGFPDWANGGQFPGQGRPGQNQFPGQGRPGQNQFPGQGRPGQNQFPGQQRPTTTTAAPTTAATNSREVQDCIRACPTTSEYNPVCGSNNNTYDNPSRLICAQNCGVAVTLRRTSRCPA